MTTISANIKIIARFEWQNSRIQVHALKDKKWQPLFEVSLKDVMKFVNTKRRMK